MCVYIYIYVKYYKCGERESIKRRDKTLDLPGLTYVQRKKPLMATSLL